jgi:hypothetical protein
MSVIESRYTLPELIEKVRKEAKFIHDHFGQTGISVPFFDCADALEHTLHKLQAAQRELAAQSADAARYRWLRDTESWYPFDDMWISRSGVYGGDGLDLDACIDCAIAALSAPEGGGR